MPEIALKETTTLRKFGVVTIYNKDKTVNNQFKITGEELKKFLDSGTIPPPNVPQEIWDAGLADVSGKDHEVGDFQIAENGDILIKYDEVEKDGRIIDYMLRLKPEENIGTKGQLTVAKPILDAAFLGKTKVVTEITDGILKWQ